MSDIKPESRDYSFDQIEDDPRLKRTTKEFFITISVYIIYGILMITNLFLFGQHSTLEAAKCETLPIVKELHIAEKAVSQAAAELKKATEENSEAAENPGERNPFSRVFTVSYTIRQLSQHPSHGNFDLS